METPEQPPNECKSEEKKKGVKVGGSDERGSNKSNEGGNEAHFLRMMRHESDLWLRDEK